jgi:DNA-binding transcriptional regulator LsrR (DeoR family)
LNSEMIQELEKECRRNKVLELSSKGYSERDIGSKLQISHITVHRDLVHLKRQAQVNLQHHIHEVVPIEYSRCIFGMKGVLKQTLEIAETSSDPKIKLEAMRIANDCYHHIMDLTTNGAIVTDAINMLLKNKNR